MTNGAVFKTNNTGLAGTDAFQLAIQNGANGLANGRQNNLFFLSTSQKLSGRDTALTALKDRTAEVEDLLERLDSAVGEEASKIQSELALINSDIQNFFGGFSSGDVTALQNQITALSSSASLLEASISDASATIVVDEASIAVIESSISPTQVQITSLQGEISSLSSSISGLESSISGLENNKTAVSNQNSSLSVTLSAASELH